MSGPVSAEATASARPPAGLLADGGLSASTPLPDGGLPGSTPLDGTLIVDLLDATAAARPDAAAVRDGDGAWSYAELADASRAVADGLSRAGGVVPGDRVVLRLGNRREFVALYYGVLRAGAVVVPLNPEMKAFVLRGVLADAAPAVVVLDPSETAPVCEAVAVSGARTATPAELLDRGAGPAGPPRRPAPDAIAQLLYTSGSTSAPKGVVCTQRQVVFAARAIARRLGYRPDDVVLAALPLSFDYGLYQVLLAAIGGSELVLADASAPVRAMSVLRRCRATVVPVVPSLAEMLCRLAARGAPPGHVRLFTNTGAALAGSVAGALRAGFPGAAVVAMYGITECKRVTIAEPDSDLVRPGSVGRPLDGTTVEVLDAAGRALPPGEVGEIVVGGPHVMAGYWNAPEPTARRFRPDPDTGRTRLHTGDHGRLDAEGHLYFSGRLDDQFKRRGVRMGTPEIEAAALDVPGVRAAAALAPRDGLDLRLVVTGDAGLTAEHVIEGVGQRLEPAKVPAVCRVIARMPLTPNGKIDRKALDTDAH
ncbi:class I adenylate-forming enzyme family protein [Streptomyces sp. NBC_00083]|uniref:class I adenylate-forming enzyme family protein n=1 Tax=Streptomyces sp. NBC_00083 TaxID=2975647 RepID=UPI00224F52DD|nr:AMP-binding protein [Streptomyces sp. NBC_00083]MCX5387056.1 AMP-binding protein [Streptomyces sp. NBC_00083]